MYTTNRPGFQRPTLLGLVLIISIPHLLNARLLEGISHGVQHLMSILDDHIHEDDETTVNSRHITPAEQGCRVIRGRWCQRYWKQKDSPVPGTPRFNRTCPGDCNNRGVCDASTGLCYCQAGWKGAACVERDDSLCYNSGPDGRDINTTIWKVHKGSRCMGICDMDTATCWCPPETKYGRMVDPSAPPGSKPVKEGRPMAFCYPNKTADGTPLEWSWHEMNRFTWDDLFGSDGWCNADVAYRAVCPCTYDGLVGPSCDERVEQMCINQCSGNGDCLRGFCKCKQGWFGEDCSQKVAGLPYDPEPWPAHLLHTVEPAVAAVDPPVRQTRKKPYIYVYNMDPMYTSRLLNYRLERGLCTYREYTTNNRSGFTHWAPAYGMETLLHELLLTSEHRTLDPEEAHFFYVPIYTACLSLLLGNAAKPVWPAGDNILDDVGQRSFRLSMMAHDAVQWVKTTFPYWNRTEGRDHMFLFPHDEGACYYHKEIWDGVVLSHWGRTDFPHYSMTSWLPDKYSLDLEDSNSRYGQWIRQTSGTHPCFDPIRHLVIPDFKPPDYYKRSPYMNGHNESQPRDVLFFFRGDLRLWDVVCQYSRCIRQTLHKLHNEGKWQETYNALYGTREELPGDYGSYLTRSKFCLALPGDGYSPRFEDAILHGCIPVVINDFADGVFENILDYSKFALRVREKYMDKLPELLRSIPEERVNELRHEGSKVWMRFRWMGTPMVRNEISQVLESNKDLNHTMPVPGSQYANTSDHDAFSTLMAWLYSRVKYTRPRRQQHVKFRAT